MTPERRRPNDPLSRLVGIDIYDMYTYNYNMIYIYIYIYYIIYLYRIRVYIYNIIIYIYIEIIDGRYSQAGIWDAKGGTTTRDTDRVSPLMISANRLDRFDQGTQHVGDCRIFKQYDLTICNQWKQTTLSSHE
jgi:hypothetical protein